jgi:hypothetical protein
MALSKNINSTIKIYQDPFNYNIQLKLHNVITMGQRKNVNNNQIKKNELARYTLNITG